MVEPYAPATLERDAVEALPGAVVLDFGTNWCGHCRRAEPLIAAALARHPQVRHLRIEDGSGRRLGRAFQVKLWPTLVFLRDGRERARLVRPADSTAIEEALARITGGDPERPGPGRGAPGREAPGRPEEG